MAVHTLGNTAAPSYGANDTSSYTEIAPGGWPAMPANGYITQLFGYFGSTSGGAITAHLLLVSSGGALLVDGGAQTVYGQTWQSRTISPYYVLSGAGIGVAWWHTGELHFSVYNHSTFQAGSPGAPSGLSGFVTPGSPYFQGGTGYYMQWIDPLSVSSASGSGSAHAGDTIYIYGAGFTGGSISSVTFNGIGASWGVDSDTQMHAVVPSGNSTGTLAVNSDHGNGSVGWTLGSPTISSLSPPTAVAGQQVTVYGSGFTDGSVSSVSVNGIGASYSVQSNTQLTVTIPNGYTTGSLVVNTNHGSASANFTEGPPSVTSITPSSASPGQPVTIAGSGFTDGSVSSVTFNGITSSYTVNSNTQITATVPTGASGNDTVTVNTNHGSASGNLTVIDLRVSDGAAFQNSAPSTYDGALWQPVSCLIFDGTTWQQSV